MSLLLSTIISGALHPHHPFVVLESSLVQSSLPVLRAILNGQDEKTNIMLLNLLYPSSSLIDGPSRGGLRIIDRTAEVPGYSDGGSDLFNTILTEVAQAPEGPLTVVVDSADVLCADLESPSRAAVLVASILDHIRARPKPSRLIMHLSTPSPLRELLLRPRLSPVLAWVTAHPPALLRHLATAQLTPPPPASTPDRFWRVFAPLAARTWEVERIVLGTGGPGPNDEDEIVLEVLTRASDGRRRSIERVLEGWARKEPCPLTKLEGLKSVLTSKSPLVERPMSEATGDVSFNLSLTPEQQQSRAKQDPQPPGVILYDPDSADDIDDDDPDEDLDI
ncbi:hypothetical protein BC834DRAFT_965162 [Gloeopeniophorella convolvens]|nr:hypothetical protein BC834DRAFT_965162 [Gloeopeniophorella convolvens]